MHFVAPGRSAAEAADVHPGPPRLHVQTLLGRHSLLRRQRQPVLKRYLWCPAMTRWTCLSLPKRQRRRMISCIPKAQPKQLGPRQLILVSTATHYAYVRRSFPSFGSPFYTEYNNEHLNLLGKRAEQLPCQRCRDHHESYIRQRLFCS